MHTPPAPPYSSSRAHPRLKLVTPVHVQVGIDSFLCYTEDISVGGLGAKSAQPPPNQTRLKLLFNLPTGSPVIAEGIVRYASADRFGVQFVDLPADTQEVLDAYTRRTLGSA